MSQCHSTVARDELCCAALDPAPLPNEKPLSARTCPSKTVARFATKISMADSEAMESTKAYLDELCRRSRSLEFATSAELVRELLRIVQKRDLRAWPNWRDSVLRSPLASFTGQPYRDEAAVCAALQHK